MNAEPTIKRLEFDKDKAQKLYNDLVTLFRDAKPTVGEIIIAYANLGYALGASIEGIKGTGPSIDELNKRYYSNPTVGVAMMLQAMEVATWYEDWERVITKDKSGGT